MEQYFTSHLRPHLYAVKDNTDETKLISAAWTFAYTALWNCMHFSPKEIAIAKQSISDLFTPVNNKQEAFIIFCERVLLARKYILSDKKRFIPLPSVWLNKHNPKGFAGTKKWHNVIAETRHSIPFYKSEIRSIAKSVFDYSEHPSYANYCKWKNYFISRREHASLIIFQLYVVNRGRL